VTLKYPVKSFRFRQLVFNTGKSRATPQLSQLPASIPVKKRCVRTFCKRMWSILTSFRIPFHQILGKTRVVVTTGWTQLNLVP
jgi:hypothetical protein